jgi:hypothetical protein
MTRIGLASDLSGAIAGLFWIAVIATADEFATGL